MRLMKVRKWKHILSTTVRAWWQIRRSEDLKGQLTSAALTRSNINFCADTTDRGLILWEVTINSAFGWVKLMTAALSAGESAVLSDIRHGPVVVGLLCLTFVFVFYACWYKFVGVCMTMCFEWCSGKAHSSAFLYHVVLHVILFWT